MRARWDLNPSRPRLRLAKMVSRPSLKTSLQTIQHSCKFIDLQRSYLFMFQQFFMVAFMLDMQGTSNSTAMKFFPTPASCSIQGKWAVTIYFVSTDSNSINRANFLNYLCYWSWRDMVVATDWFWPWFSIMQLRQLR